MTGSIPAVPPIPLPLIDRPTIGGLVVPWLTGRAPDGRYRFGTIDANKHALAIKGRHCQTCGHLLGDKIVFAMRDSDIKRFISPEPGMHPVCAHYSANACPMLAGRMEHYRTTSATAGLAELGVISFGDPGNLRAGSPSQPWNLVWASGYQPIIDPATGQPAAQLLRVRPIGGVA